LDVRSDADEGKALPVVWYAVLVCAGDLRSDVVVVVVCGVLRLEESGELPEMYPVVMCAEAGYVFDDEGFGSGMADVVNRLLVELASGIR
jgi:hypothetical protein